jgi:hypothetical protein
MNEKVYEALKGVLSEIDYKMVVEKTLEMSVDSQKKLGIVWTWIDEVAKEYDKSDYEKLVGEEISDSKWEELKEIKESEEM